MEGKQYKNLVIETISELSYIKIAEISFESSFEYLEFDNLDLAELIMSLEDKLNITEDDSMYYAKTVRELNEKLNNQIQTSRNLDK